MESSDPGASPRPVVRLRDIRKRFGPVEVLSGVQLDLYPGEIHVLAGENGAGKSTLMKILGGVYPDFEGTLELRGKSIRPDSPQNANALGIAVIYQELSLIPAMSVAENIFLGQAPVAKGGFVRRKEIFERAKSILLRLGMDSIDVRLPVERLSVGDQQMVEIAKALSRDASVVIMDEPTSALSAPEVERLFALIDGLKQRGCAIVYITHKMEEIERVADRITVLRDGKYVGSAPAKDLPIPKLIQWMVGREVSRENLRRTSSSPEIRLRVDSFGVRRHGRACVRNVSFDVHRGEILGVAGLQGSGASDLFLGLFGAIHRRGVTGRVELDGREIAITSPQHAMDHGIALVPSDRKTSGLVLQMSIVANSTLAILPSISKGGWRRHHQERHEAQRLGRDLHLHAANLDMEVGELSGGNQQKVVLAKWLAMSPKLLLLDEPTRGIDISAKCEIYRLMNEWTERGISILLITSELPELLAMSDRLIVMHRGEVMAEFTRSQATPDKILNAAMGSRHLSEVA